MNDTTETRAVKALKKELRDEARRWAEKKTLNGTFIGMALLWGMFSIAIVVAGHHFQQSFKVELSWGQAILAFLAVCITPLAWLYSRKRNKWRTSPQFNQMVLANLKDRLNQMHAKKKKGVLMETDGNLLNNEISTAEALYREMTSSTYQYKGPGLDIAPAHLEGALNRCTPADQLERARLVATGVSNGAKVGG